MHMDYDQRISKINGNNRDEYKKTLSLINALRKELNGFNYEGDYRNLSHFLIKINELRPSLNSRKQKVIDVEIVKLHKMVRDLITSRPNYITKRDSNFLELKTIIDNLEGMNLSYMYHYIDQYDGDAYNLIRYLLFEEKNLFFVKYALERYPHFMNIRDGEGNGIIFEVVDKYLQAINDYIASDLNYSDDLFFFDQVLEIVINSEKMDYSLEMTRCCLKKIDDFLNDFDYSKLNGEKKNKLIFWANELKNKLEGKEKEETLGHLSYKTDITIDFNEAILSESKRFDIDSLQREYKKRRLIEDEYIITVDGDEAEEIDDGLSACKLENGNYLLGVHISDPFGYLNKNSILYDEAYRRTTSIYSPLERTSSMFPENYAKDYMSLTENKNRFATSYYLEITPTGEILMDSCRFEKTVAKVDKSLTYEKFNELVQRGSSDSRLEQTIGILQEICDVLSKRIVMDERYRIANRETLNTSGTNIIGNGNGEKIIEYAMIAANSTVANYAAMKGIPFIYRGHELSREYLEKIDYFSNLFEENPTTENYDVFVKLLKGTYPTAFYTTDQNIKHMGIGIPHYCHLTSPLRRFADCLANEALEMFYFNTPPDDKKVYDFEERLKEGCRHINEKRKTIDYFTKRYINAKK